MSTNKAIVLALASALMFTEVHAQAVATIDGTDISQSQLEAYAIGRTGAEATAENRAALIEQIGDLVLLSNIAQKEGLAKDSRVAADLELQRRSVLAAAYIRNFNIANPITDEDALAEYERQIAQYPRPTQYKARHILLESEEDANAIIKSLDDGADFETLAKEKSTGPSGPQGGDLGWFDAGAMVAPFSAAVVAMEDGTYSKTPVQTQFGWHVILREDTRQANPPSFDELKDRLKAGMEQQNFQTFFNTLKENATLEIK